MPFPTLICNHLRFYSTSSPIKLYDSYEKITSEVINHLLRNQQVSITQKELDELKAIPDVKFSLPFNYDTFHAFIALVGRQRSSKSGVYMFIHKVSGRKYVGSSKNLSYRLFS